MSNCSPLSFVHNTGSAARLVAHNRFPYSCIVEVIVAIVPHSTLFVQALVVFILPAPDALVVFFQESVSLLALSSYLSAPSTSLEGSRKSISDTKQLKELDASRRLQSKTISPLVKDIKFTKKRVDNLLSHQKQRYSFAGSRIFCHQSLSPSTTRLFSNNTSLNTLQRNHIYQNEVLNLRCRYCCRSWSGLRSLLD